MDLAYILTWFYLGFLLGGGGEGKSILKKVDPRGGEKIF